jgi:hypothetical protein
MEMSYQDCADNGGVFWEPAPCEIQIGCCTWLDISVGPLGVTVQTATTQAECNLLEGVWTPEPCEDDCAECCEAIRALLESFTDDVQVPLRDWLLEDWPDFSERVLTVLEEPQEPEPEPNGVEGDDVDAAVGEAGSYFEGITVPNDSSSSTNWTFDVLGTEQSFSVSMDPRNWPDTPMYTALGTAILVMRIALSIGLTIMFGSMVGRVLRQW